MTEDKARSVAQRRRGMIVEASPFNGVKLELGIILVVLVCALIVIESRLDSVGAQIGWLLALASAATIWLVVRTRQVVHKTRERQSTQDGQD